MFDVCLEKTMKFPEGFPHLYTLRTTRSIGAVCCFSKQPSLPLRPIVISQVWQQESSLKIELRKTPSMDAWALAERSLSQNCHGISCTCHFMEAHLFLLDAFHLAGMGQVSQVPYRSNARHRSLNRGQQRWAERSVLCVIRLVVRHTAHTKPHCITLVDWPS